MPNQSERAGRNGPEPVTRARHAPRAIVPERGRALLAIPPASLLREEGSRRGQAKATRTDLFQILWGIWGRTTHFGADSECSALSAQQSMLRPRIPQPRTPHRERVPHVPRATGYVLCVVTATRHLSPPEPRTPNSETPNSNPRPPNSDPRTRPHMLPATSYVPSSPTRSTTSFTTSPSHRRRSGSALGAGRQTARAVRPAGLPSLPGVRSFSQAPRLLRWREANFPTDAAGRDRRLSPPLPVQATDFGAGSWLVCRLHCIVTEGR